MCWPSDCSRCFHLLVSGVLIDAGTSVKGGFMVEGEFGQLLTSFVDDLLEVLTGQPVLLAPMGND